jgi:hypothetical protein
MKTGSEREIFIFLFKGQQPSTQASSIFGGASTGSFSATTTPAQPFGSPQNAFGSGDNKPSVFGTPQQQTGILRYRK